MSKIGGVEKVRDNDKAMTFLSDYRNLLECIPGVRRIESGRFLVEASIGPMRVELSGEVKEHKVTERQVTNLMEVLGPGLTLVIKTIVEVGDNELNWSADYDISGALAKALQNTIGREAERVSRQIISCTVSKINAK